MRVVGVSGGYTATQLNGDKTQPYCTLFECAAVGGKLEPRDGEALAFAYLSLNNVPEHFLFPKAVLAADYRGVYFSWDERWLAGLELLVLQR